MNSTKHVCLFLISALLMNSCASYQSKLQTDALSFPELGSIVKTKGHLWYANAAQIGTPTWEKPVKVTIQELPFNKATYATYTKYTENASKINSIAYVDSLPYKPKYLRLQILDKIAVTAQLNFDKNKELRTYLENDPNYKMVTAIDVSLTDENKVKLLDADAAYLQKSGFNAIALLLVKGGQTQVFSLSELEIFDYEFSTFCWGEDIYHNKKIKAILNGNENCPQGTFNKAAKVKENKSYLKF